MGDVRASVYDFMTHGMFEDSGCPSISPPVKEMGGPFCYSCPAPIDYFESNAQLRAALLDFKEQDCTYKECYVEQRYGPINTWNVSGVNNFARVFSGLNWFNEDISGWDTSNVFAMPETFQYAKKFNQVMHIPALQNLDTFFWPQALALSHTPLSLYYHFWMCRISMDGMFPTSQFLFWHSWTMLHSIKV